MAKGQRDRAKERLWRQHLAAWRRSGLSVRAFCAAQGLSEPSFYSWRRMLTQRDRRGVCKSASGGGTVSGAALAADVSPFVPVRLVDDKPPATVEVVLRGGRVVRVAAGFDAQVLRAVVAALEEGDLPC
jgi:transposase